MLDPRSHEKEVAGLKHVPFAIVNENSSATNDEVDLILCVRRLPARAHREGEGYIQGAMPKGDDSMLSRRYLHLGRGNAENTTTI